MWHWLDYKILSKKLNVFWTSGLFCRYLFGWSWLISPLFQDLAILKYLYVLFSKFWFWFKFNFNFNVSDTCLLYTNFIWESLKYNCLNFLLYIHVNSYYFTAIKWSSIALELLLDFQSFTGILGLVNMEMIHAYG